jgi:hypothetical protein
VAHFWALLADFCGLNLAPQRWRDEVPGEHPFLRWAAADDKGGGAGGLAAVGVPGMAARRALEALCSGSPALAAMH